MRIHKNLFGTNSEDKIHVDEIAVAPDLLLGGAVIVDSGSNENGHFVKYGDGTMICRHRESEISVTTTSRTEEGISGFFSDWVWIYPEPFIEASTAIGSSVPYYNSAAIVFSSSGINSSYDNRAALRTWSFRNHNILVYVDLIAIGRWKQLHDSNNIPLEPRFRNGQWEFPVMGYKTNYNWKNDSRRYGPIAGIMIVTAQEGQSERR